jgi:glycosyltransferase involved in cell wall biosynthesis
MRILHVIQSLAPRYGGPSLSIVPMVAALNRLPNLSAEIATTNADGPRHHSRPTSSPGTFPIHVFPRTFSEQWKYSWQLSRWLKREAKNFDVIHIHGLWSHCNSAAAAAAFAADVPYVIRPAGMLSEYSLNYKAPKKRLYWAAVERRSVMRADCFHVTSEEECAEVRRVRPNATVFVIPQGMPQEAFDTPVERELLAERCGPAVAGRPIILFLSRLHPKKGLADILLPAISRLKTNAFLAIAGGPDPAAPDYEQEVRRKVAHLGIADRVAFLGPITPAERWHLFDGASVFVLPSYSENFGIVVTEAMARGCPLVVTEGVQAHTHVTAANAGLVVPLDVGKVAVAIDQVLQDSTPGTTRGREGAEYVRTHLGWDGIAKKIDEMYRVVALHHQRDAETLTVRNAT